MDNSNSSGMHYQTSPLWSQIKVQQTEEMTPESTPGGNGRTRKRAVAITNNPHLEQVRETIVFNNAAKGNNWNRGTTTNVHGTRKVKQVQQADTPEGSSPGHSLKFQYASPDELLREFAKQKLSAHSQPSDSTGTIPSSPKDLMETLVSAEDPIFLCDIENVFVPCPMPKEKKQEDTPKKPQEEMHNLLCQQEESAPSQQNSNTPTQNSPLGTPNSNSHEIIIEELKEKELQLEIDQLHIQLQLEELKLKKQSLKKHSLEQLELDMQMLELKKRKLSLTTQEQELKKKLQELEIGQQQQVIVEQHSSPKSGEVQQRELTELQNKGKVGVQTQRHELILAEEEELNKRMSDLNMQRKSAQGSEEILRKFQEVSDLIRRASK